MQRIKRKWYKTPWKIICFVLLLMIVVFFVISGVYESYLQGIEMRHRIINARFAFNLTWDGQLPSSTRTLRYSSVESSVYAYYSDNEFQTSDVYDELLVFKEERYNMSIFFGESTSYSFPFLTRNITSITLTVLETDGVNYSAPRYIWIQGIETVVGGYGVWNDEDRIARDVVISHFRGDITSKVNNGNTLFYGVGIGNIPEISILGYAPDNIIPFNYNEEDYFFWYYYDMPMLSDILEAHIDFEAFTLAEVIELLEIEVR